MRTVCICLFVLILAPVADAEGARRAGQWYFGFGLGSGEANLTIDGEEVDYDDFFTYPDGRSVDSMRLSLFFDGGVQVAPKVLVGGHLAAIVQVGEANGVERSVGHSQLLATVTYFPTREGLFLRGGVGAASVKLQVRDLDGPTKITAEERGTGVMVGLGYALPMGPSMHFTISLDVHGATFDGRVGSPSEAAFGALQLGLAWL